MTQTQDLTETSTWRSGGALDRVSSGGGSLGSHCSIWPLRCYFKVFKCCNKKKLRTYDAKRRPLNKAVIPHLLHSRRALLETDLNIDEPLYSMPGSSGHRNSDLFDALMALTM